MVRPSAVVIDVGINELPQGGIVGDVDFASMREVAGARTPTHFGVGPLTNILSLKLCVEADWQEVDHACSYHIQVLLPCRASANLHDDAHDAFMAFPPPMTMLITLS
jgi:hypothetical protein